MQLLLIATCLSSPTPKDNSHTSTFSHSIVSGAGVGLGASVAGNLVDRFFANRDRRRAEREVRAAQENIGCIPGSIVIIDSLPGPKKGVVAQDCSVFTG
jgi:hypothetical protein